MCEFGSKSHCFVTVSIFSVFVQNSCIWLTEFFVCSENARLKSLHHNLIASRQSSRHFSISIPRVVQRLDENSNRKYFAYEIQITPLRDNGDREKWSLLRRYSEFHRLHKYLQKDNIVIKTLDFPPKKSFGNMVSNWDKFEQRRKTKNNNSDKCVFNFRMPNSLSCVASDCKFICCQYYCWCQN